MQFFDELNVLLQEIPHNTINQETKLLIPEICKTLESIQEGFEDSLYSNPIMQILKKSLPGLSRQLSNISLSISDGGHLNPDHNIAGRIKDFKASFSAFASSIQKYKNSIISGLVIETFIEHIIYNFS